MEKLKPCPFCGGEARINERLEPLHGMRYYPTCMNKHCLGRNTAKYFEIKATAIAAWNRRTNDEHGVLGV